MTARRMLPGVRDVLAARLERQASSLYLAELRTLREERARELRTLAGLAPHVRHPQRHRIAPFTRW